MCNSAIEISNIIKMKKVGLLFCAVVIAINAMGQLHEIGDRIGIGSDTPLTKLHVVDNVNSEVLRIESSTNSSQIMLKATGLGGIGWNLMSTANGASLGGAKFSIFGNGQHRFVLDQNGKIGVNISNPSEELEIHVADAFGEILISSERNNNGENLGRIGFKGLSNTGSAIKYAGVKGGILDNTTGSSKGTLFFETYDGGFGSRMTIAGSDIGIGTTSPLEKLHIENGALQFYNLGSGEDNVDIIKIAENTTSDEFSLVGMFNGFGESGNSLKWRSSWKDDLFVLRGDGKIGIGTSDFTANHKLRVEGSIGAREIKVEASGWSDFVFEKEYELRTLEEVEDYISENKHLPDVPSEKEVTENGINLGDMNTKLLQKIEELTLYLIEQNKQNQAQQAKIEQLEKEITALKKK